MGRVSKFKRVRPCDPFYKGPRKPSVRKGDFPPSIDEDQLPPKGYHLLNPTTAPRKKPKSKSKGDINDGQRRAGLDSSGADPPSSSSEPSQKNDSPAFVRMPGESQREYLDRIDLETKIKLAGCLTREKKSERRKRYMKERKIKFQMKHSQRAEIAGKEFSDFKDQVKFGEVVQAPPRLSAKPRGSQPKRKKGVVTSASSSLVDNPPVVGLKEEHDLEQERLKMISHYRLAKKKRTERTL